MASLLVKGWTTSEFGIASEVLRLGDVIVPTTLEPKELLIKVKAAALNPVDLYVISGNFNTKEGMKFPVSL